MTVKLYLPRMSHQHHDRMMEVHHWIEKQFGRPDYHTNYSLDFGDHTEDWCCYTFYDETQAFWTQARFSDILLTHEQWYNIVDDNNYEQKRTLGLLKIYDN
jgi:hypothetical protein